MKHLLTILLLLLTPVGNAAVYYVSPTGSNTSPYDTWAKAANLPSTAVTAGNTDTGGDGTYSQTYAAYTDYRLQIASPCINAGVDVGLTVDYAGTAVPQGDGPDMGAYEYEFSGGTLFHSGIFGGSVLK